MQPRTGFHVASVHSMFELSLIPGLERRYTGVGSARRKAPLCTLNKCIVTGPWRYSLWKPHTSGSSANACRTASAEVCGKRDLPVMARVAAMRKFKAVGWHHDPGRDHRSARSEEGVGGERLGAVVLPDLRSEETSLIRAAWGSVAVGRSREGVAQGRLFTCEVRFT